MLEANTFSLKLLLSVGGGISQNNSFLSTIRYERSYVLLLNRQEWLQEEVQESILVPPPLELGEGPGVRAMWGL